MPANDSGLNVGELAAAVVANDPELRGQLSTLMRTIVAHMQFTMVHGSAAEKTALAKSITPQLLKGLQKADASNEDEEMAAAYAALREELTGGQGIAQ